MKIFEAVSNRLALAALVALAIAVAGDAGAQQVSFTGKQVTFMHNTPPGSSVDVFARQVGPYVVKNLPGAPEFIVVAKPGGQFLLGPSFVQKNVAPDGLTLGMFATLPGQVATRVKLPFDIAEFVFAGGVGQTYVYYGRKDIGIASGEEFRNPKNEIILGGAAPNTNSHLVFRLFTQAIGMGGKYKEIFGLQGQMGQLKAMRSNDANLGSMLGTLFLQMRSGLDKEGMFVTLFETGDLGADGNVRPTPELGIPTIDSLWRKWSPQTVDSKEYRAYKLLLTTMQLTWVFALPPKTPATFAAVWDQAFAKALREPGFIADMKKAGTIVPEWVNGPATVRGIAAVKRAASDPEYEAAIEPHFRRR